MENKHIRKRHNVTMLLYHIVLVAKYRKSVFTEKVDETVRKVSIEIEERYEIKFLEIGADENHIHFLVQSVPMYSPQKIVQTIKSILAKEIFKNNPDVKKWLWG